MVWDGKQLPPTLETGRKIWRDRLGPSRADSYPRPSKPGVTGSSPAGRANCPSSMDNPWTGTNNNMAIRAVLFDLGNTLVRYYTSSEFPAVLRRCLQECTSTLGWAADPVRHDELFERALLLNREEADYAVRSLGTRLEQLFSASRPLDNTAASALAAAFMAPIFAMARVDPEAVAVLESLRSLGIKTAIVSNTPWGSSASAWREELTRHGLLDKVDATVFCMDVGWRKPHRAPFDRALSLLRVTPSEALFVGDDHRWDVAGAHNAGLRPVLLGPGPAGDHHTVETLRGVVALVTRASESSGAA
jgi:HAD superfamily hydrolase (TIGR01509 family)